MVCALFSMLMLPSLQNLTLAFARVIKFYGAGERIRTLDLLITNQLLYQLSYTGMCLNAYPYAKRAGGCLVYKTTNGPPQGWGGP